MMKKLPWSLAFLYIITCLACIAGIHLLFCLLNPILKNRKILEYRHTCRLINSFFFQSKFNFLKKIYFPEIFAVPAKVEIFNFRMCNLCQLIWLILVEDMKKKCYGKLLISALTWNSNLDLAILSRSAFYGSSDYRLQMLFFQHPNFLAKSARKQKV